MNLLRWLLGAKPQGHAAHATQNTMAHDLLLSKFLRANDPSSFDGCDYWTAPLGRPVQQVLKQAIADGLLVPDDNLERRLDYKARVTDLKHILRERKLKVSGKKAELIARVIGADRASAERIVEGVNLFRCSDSERERLQAVLEREKRNRQETEEAVLGAIQEHRFSDAASIVVKFEAAQVFPRGVGLSWDASCAQTLRESIESIFGPKWPKLLATVPQESREAIRVTAAMFKIWGFFNSERCFPDGLDLGTHIERGEVPKMLVSHALHLEHLKEYRNMGRDGVNGVEILIVEDNSTCDRCRALKGQTFSLSKVPEIPHEKCTSTVGCRCYMVGRF